jgi:hypothetical protein
VRRLLAFVLLYVFTAGACWGLLTIRDDQPFTGGTINSAMFKDTTGRTEVSSAIAEKTSVEVVFGQSMLFGFTGTTPYTPSKSKRHAVNPYDAKVYVAKDPLPGMWLIPGGGHSYITRSLDGDIADFERRIVIPYAVGSTSIVDWGVGGTLHQFVRHSTRIIKHFGWHQNSLVTITVHWDQGHGDAGMASATYVNHWLRMQRTYFEQGISVVWFVAITSYASPPGTPSATMQAAEAALTAIPNIKLGPNSDQFTDRTADGVHLTDASTAQTATLRNQILNAHFAPRRRRRRITRAVPGAGPRRRRACARRRSCAGARASSGRWRPQPSPGTSRPRRKTTNPSAARPSPAGSLWVGSHYRMVVLESLDTRSVRRNDSLIGWSSHDFSRSHCRRLCGIADGRSAGGTFQSVAADVDSLPLLRHQRLLLGDLVAGSGVAG